VTARLRSHASIWKKAKRLADDLTFDLTFDVWKQSVALSLLADHWAANNLSPRIFAVIGDGYGFLGALIRRHFPDSRIYSIDLPKILVFQARTHELADAGASMSIMSEKSAPAAITFVQPKDLETIPDQIDCAFNIASMQEMNDHSISSYFKFLRAHSTPSSRFYCVNRQHKELPGGEIRRFIDYPWQNDDEVFIDGICPYYTHIAGHTESNGPRIFGVRVPFINHFDGPIMHRLVHLAPI